MVAMLGKEGKIFSVSKSSQHKKITVPEGTCIRVDRWTTQFWHTYNYHYEIFDW